jgi:hypothetical protein
VFLQHSKLSQQRLVVHVNGSSSSLQVSSSVSSCPPPLLCLQEGKEALHDDGLGVGAAAARGVQHKVVRHFERGRHGVGRAAHDLLRLLGVELLF